MHVTTINLKNEQQARELYSSFNEFYCSLSVWIKKQSVIINHSYNSKNEDVLFSNFFCLWMGKNHEKILTVETTKNSIIDKKRSRLSQKIRIHTTEESVGCNLLNLDIEPTTQNFVIYNKSIKNTITIAFNNELHFPYYYKEKLVLPSVTPANKWWLIILHKQTEKLNIPFELLANKIMPKTLKSNGSKPKVYMPIPEL
ncbi:hypothetical protein [Photobacterium leiognathi]|uniref:hypothetical protein n=1 Tax=Photobacterium leiognathi TaxID=553611 RepID=UPI0029817ED6|nr:hypothetical protein [Photobacterium leiognathi]